MLTRTDRSLRSQLGELEQQRSGLEAQLQEQRAVARQLQQAHARLQQQQQHTHRGGGGGGGAGGGVGGGGEAPQTPALAVQPRDRHAIDIPASAPGRVVGAAAGAPAPALQGFTPGRSSQWSLWSLLLSLNSMTLGRQRTHHLLSV